MRKAAPLVLSLALAAPTAAAGQTWSDEQQEVLDGIERCWDIWMEAVEAGTPEPFLSQCQTEDSTFWVASDAAPNVSKTYLERTWGVETGIDLAWLDLRPLHVAVDGDVAVVHFVGYWRLPGPEVSEWKRTEVWRRVDGMWRQWAGHATPTN